MGYLLNGCHNIIWCTCSAVWWYSNPIFCINLMIFAKVLQRDLCDGLGSINNGLNEIKILDGDCKIPILDFDKATFSTSEICGNILDIFWGGIITTKSIYKINWETWRWNVLLEIVVCGLFCLVLGIYGIGFREEKASGAGNISKGESGSYHYFYTFDIYYQAN